MSRNALHLIAMKYRHFNTPAINLLIEKGIDARCRDKVTPFHPLFRRFIINVKFRTEGALSTGSGWLFENASSTALRTLLVRL